MCVNLKCVIEVCRSCRTLLLTSPPLKSELSASPSCESGSPAHFVLLTTQPLLDEVEGRIVRELRRVGKRIAISVEGDLWLVFHLMIAEPLAGGHSPGEARCRAVAHPP